MPKHYEILEKTKVPMTNFEKVGYTVAALILVVMWIGLVVWLPYLPEEVPRQVSFTGEVSYDSKKMLLFLPSIASLMFIIIAPMRFAVSMMNFPVRVTEENAAVLIRYNRHLMVHTLLLVITLSVMIILASIAVGYGWGASLLLLSTCPFFVWIIGVLIYYYKRMKQVG
ncbi:DUF1648 domain-containing protein [Shouchella lonarensis]|uniref:DUF1648 domain-containing protein n=1 Tax=Shouchella lonarensis TaxID=1464122 RepID=A0A1G6INA5_9BACI|nr:DUF1648 domain-containing protein [Shouchella lonarensis]SDC07901.1 hypothetical protein SAMN05421737_105118 [Shouchella lonarensis]